MAQPKNSSGIPSGGDLVCDENDKWDARFHHEVEEPRIPVIAAVRHNRLQLLRCPGSSSVFVFFPTGENSDRVGFVVVSAEHSELGVKRGDGYGDDRDGDVGGVLVSKEKFGNRILRLLVNPVPHSCSGSGKYSTTTIGYLMASTMYAVHWFRIRIRGLGPDFERLPFLDFLGSKLFKSCSVVHCCWSQHLPEESAVLLDSGELFLFDLLDYFSNKTRGLNRRISGKRIRISWKDCSNSLEKGGWLSCEFSWHPRILIVAHSCNVFLVDLRVEGCNVSCLLKIDTLVINIAVQTDRFVAFSKAGSDGFCFVVASNHWLLLCDVRKPFMPLLQWAHDLPNPLCINVFSLSQLRSHSKDDHFKWASDTGYCIVMGSFWNCEFCLFCYGPPLRASEISSLCKSFYAWERPSELSLSDRECHCGSCLVREEFSKDALPKWVDWQQKKDIVLGFGILDKDLHNELSSEKDGFGGFTLIRLMSSGKLESQRYCASWEFAKVLEGPHKESSLHFEDSVLYAMGEEDFKFRKRYKYLTLHYLNEFMHENLSKALFTKIEKLSKDACEKSSFSAGFHQCICEKLRACGLSKLTSPPLVSDVLKDTRFLTSIHEVALRRIWAVLPTDLLQLAFSSYSELLEVLEDQKKVSLEFLDVPSQPQLPPFVFRTPSCRSTKWSKKVQPSTAFVGPVVPTPVLFTLRNLRMEEEEAYILSANAQVNNLCNEVLGVASEMATPGSVSLSDDKDTSCYSTLKENPFSLHKPAALSCEFSSMDPTQGDSVCNKENFTTFVSKAPVKELVSNNRTEMVGLELFNSLSPLDLKFDDCMINFGPKELKALKMLTTQYSKFLQV
ncbi:hypothetical protein RHSIM_Rhsim12G0029000 [Rhododendron simsii]|uniref:Uncharacterized protein n=1 Tax=Rhododendron simsii TaxID=118357 RepID=A0A834G7T0_RHOSS|nr:hypothetical protein RHSIM_Rhsim12G0029000 [Rhododendron simsii]